MRRWEKMLFCFIMLVMVLFFVWSIITVKQATDQADRLTKRLEERDIKITESISLGRVSKED